MADCVPPAKAEQTVAGGFHLRRGDNVELSEGDTVAIIGGVHRFANKITTRRVVFSSKPIYFRDSYISSACGSTPVCK